MIQEILTTLRPAFATFASELLRHLPRVLSALALLLAGWILASVLRGLTRTLFRLARFDAILKRVGAADFLLRAGAKEPHRLLGAVVYWLTWTVVVFAALRALDMASAEALVGDFVGFMPRLISAMAVMVIGFFLSNVAWRATLLAGVNARLHAAKLLGGFVRVLVLLGASAVAIEQIEVGRGIVHTAFAISFGAIMLAAAIAFGLGGRHAARKFLDERLLAKQEEKEEDPGSHL